MHDCMHITLRSVLLIKTVHSKQFKEPIKSTAHSSQQTHGNCTSTTFLKTKLVSASNISQWAHATTVASEQTKISSTGAQENFFHPSASCATPPAQSLSHRCPRKLLPQVLVVGSRRSTLPTTTLPSTSQAAALLCSTLPWSNSSLPQLAGVLQYRTMVFPDLNFRSTWRSTT
jgi:hypothetical protein